VYDRQPSSSVHNDQVIVQGNGRTSKTDLASSDHDVSKEDSLLIQSDEENLTDGLVLDADDEVVKRAMGMLRLGRAGARQSSDNRRAMSALRLGRRGSWTQNEFAEEDGSELDTEKDKRKSMSMLRLGRGSENHLMAEMKDEEKRKMSALRLGKKRNMEGHISASDYDDDDTLLPTPEEMGKVRDDDEKRAMGMLRLGRKADSDDNSFENTVATLNDGQKRAMGMLRLGSQSPTRIDRRKSMSMLRLG